MKIRILLFLLAMIQFQANAQRGMLADYKHTINYPDHKASFHLLQGDRDLRSTSPLKSYYWYSNNQIKATQGGYSGRLLHGLYSDHHLNGNLKELGWFNRGLKVGEWKSWNTEGILREMNSFRGGVLHGRFFRYDSIGRLAMKGKYKNGLMDGRVENIIDGKIQLSHYSKGKIKTEGEKKAWLGHLFFWRKKTAR